MSPLDCKGASTIAWYLLVRHISFLLACWLLRQREYLPRVYIVCSRTKMVFTFHVLGLARAVVVQHELNECTLQ